MSVITVRLKADTTYDLRCQSQGVVSDSIRVSGFQANHCAVLSIRLQPDREEVEIRGRW